MRAMGVCTKQAGTIKLKPVRDGCRIIRSPEQQCTTKRQLTRMIPSLPGTWVTYTHKNCSHNEEVAIRNRVIGDVPQPTKEGLSMLEAEARKIGQKIPKTSQMTHESFVNTYTGKRRQRYQHAVDDLAVRPLELPRDARISAFVKSEKFSSAGKKNPDPRLIQARNARYNTSVGIYLKPIEHHLYRLKSERTGLPLLAKGLCPKRRGEVIAQIWETFDEPVAVSFDGHRWDQHVAKEVLEIEHLVYLMSNNCSVFAKLLKAQLVNICRTQCGFWYKVLGGRMSGDMNTALGNCLLMIIMCFAYLNSLQIKFEVLDDGDDVLVFFERRHLKKVIETCHAAFLSFGQEVKVENIAFKLEDIIFCQARPVRIGDSWVMVADWRKIISQSTCGTRFWHEPKTRVDMAYSVGQCLLALYPGVPLIQTYAQQLCSFGGKMNPAIHDTDWMWKVKPTGTRRLLGTLCPEPITAASRDSFHKAYGVDALEQMLLEDMIRKWKVPTGEASASDLNEVGGEWEWDYHPRSLPTPWEW